MAATGFVTIVSTQWTDVSGTDASGFLTNHSDNDVLYVQAESLPATSLNDGHVLRPESFVNFVVAGSEVVYCRSINDIGLIAITE